jgi:predicted 2-oxoglutarate/Fe(II)-dependent dioxygenase YbiX
MIRDDGQRTLPDLDQTIVRIRGERPRDRTSVAGISSHYLNLPRAWAEF